MSDKFTEDYLDLSLNDLKEEIKQNSLLDLGSKSSGSGGQKIPYKDGSIDKNKYLQKVVELHFNEEYGSPYWIEKKEQLDFDPVKEINTFDDLKYLPEADQEALKSRRLEEFVPKIYNKVVDGDTVLDKEKIEISKSSGTTGTRKVMPWSKYVSDEMGEFYSYNLEINNQEKGSNWLVCGPYGLYEKHLERAGHKRDGFVYFTGVETRNLKKRLGGLKKISQSYKHLLNPKTVWNAVKGAATLKPTMTALKDDIESQDFQNLASSPAIIDKIHGLLESPESNTDPEDITTILISGTGIDNNTLDHLSSKYRNADIIPMYATSLTGPAFDHPDEEDISYYPLSPLVEFDVIDGERVGESETVEYEERGRVIIHRIGEDFFWPNQAERETAILKPSLEPFEWNGVSKIRPFRS